MKKEKEEICPTCQGSKITAGVCECSMEWRGNQGENEWSDCQCTPEQECLTCNGKGVIEMDQ